MSSEAFARELIDAASAPYRPKGRFAWQFARGKFAGDPFFLQLLELGLIPDSSRILDLGCGQGLLAAWLLAARGLFDAGRWPAHWPAAPTFAAYRGVELMSDDVRRGSGLSAAHIEFIHGDIRFVEFAEANVVVLLDVLHYLDWSSQEALLGRVRDALAPTGTLLLRVGDADGGLRFRLSTAVDRLATFLRGHRLSGFHCRSLRNWHALLRQLDFTVETIPMSQGTLFANVLLVAQVGPGPVCYNS